jgi:hypothetical protein
VRSPRGAVDQGRGGGAVEQRMGGSGRAGEMGEDGREGLGVRRRRRESRRPSATRNRGPPRVATRSLVASASVSAQDTTPGHAASSAALVRPTASKASLGRERLICTARSGAAPEEESGETSTKASQPLTKQSWKKSRSVPVAVDGLACCLAATVSDTIRSRRAAGGRGGEQRGG